jgi:hypothetical protein
MYCEKRRVTSYSGCWNGNVCAQYFEHLDMVTETLTARTQC